MQSGFKPMATGALEPPSDPAESFNGSVGVWAPGGCEKPHGDLTSFGGSEAACGSPLGQAMSGAGEDPLQPGAHGPLGAAAVAQAGPFLRRMLKKDGHPGFHRKGLLSPSSARTGNQFPQPRVAAAAMRRGQLRIPLRLSCKHVLLLLSAPVTDLGADLGKKNKQTKCLQACALPRLSHRLGLLLNA